MTKTKDITTITEGDVATTDATGLIKSGADLEVFKRFLAAADDGNFDTDPEAVTMEIVGRILAADTVEGVLKRADATHARDYLDKPFMLGEVRFNKGDFEDSGTNFYAVLSGADPDGEKVVVTCGAKSVIAQAWKLADMGALPLGVVIKEAKRQTAAGYKPMWLEAGPASF